MSNHAMRRSGVSRRRFLSTTGEAAAGVALATAIGGASAAAAEKAKEPAAADARAARAYEVRMAAAKLERDQTRAAQKVNGDEERYEKRWACYTKGLPHNEQGEVDSAAYAAYLKAIASGQAEDLERIPLGGYLKLANPHAALAFDLVGPDSHQLTTEPPPEYASAHFAADMVELYWKALLRDVPFAEYESNDLVRRASAELTSLGAFCGPRRGSTIDVLNVCRGGSRGGLIGPYVSQFLLRDLPWTPIRVPMKIRIAVPGRDYMTTVDEWRGIQNGGLAPVNEFDVPHYIRSGRDLAEFVHKDFSYQAFLGAALMLLKMSAPVDGAIPYQYSVNQGGFVTFGAPDVLHFVATVANLALKATWFQKWLNHRNARPEEIGGRVHFALEKKSRSPLHSDLLASDAVAMTKKRFGTALLPQSYPEGSPSHPAFPSGHAAIAGACTTVLKAWFSESWVLPQTFLPSPDGLSLQPYKGVELTVGGELDKLAENIGYGRNYAGIHFRSDAAEGLRLGEAVAIQYLREMKLTTREFFAGFHLRKFDGTQITV
jgi:membrane-associated phospholipid phosphatase